MDNKFCKPDAYKNINSSSIDIFKKEKKIEHTWYQKWILYMFDRNNNSKDEI